MFIDYKEEQKQIQKKINNDSYIRFKSVNNTNQSINQEQITPWFSNQTREIRDPLLRFHNEIIEFYQYISPTKQSHQIRVYLYKKVKTIIQEILPNAKVKPFWPLKTKLYLPDQKMNITVLIDSQQDDKTAYDTLYHHFKIYEGHFKQIQLIYKSKIQVIKFIESEYQIPFDVSMNRQDRIQQIQHVEKDINTYPQLKYIFFVLSCMLRIRSLDQPFAGYINSYSLFLMILEYLRQAHNYKKYYLVSEHILKFLQYYLRKMDRKSKNQKQLLKTYQKQGHDIKSAFEFEEITKMFKNRYRLISNYNFQFGESILQYLISPNSEKFKYTSS